MSAIMGSERWYLSIFGFLTTIVGLADSQPSFIQFFCSNDVGNYTQNSTYQTNLNTLRSSLSSNISPDGFYNSSVGDDPDRVYAIALCRGDVTHQGCQECVNDSVNEIMEVCPNQKEAIGWYARCMFRYSSKNILHNMTTKPSINIQSSKVPANVSLYLKQLRNLSNTLRNQAVGGSSLRKFASGISNSDNNVQTIYAYMQCTPNLDAGDCNLCLGWALENMTQCCNGKDGARVIGPSCIYWYEGFPFLNENVTLSPSLPPPPLALSQSPAPPQKGKDDSKTTMIIVYVISTVVLLILAFGIFICRRKWQNWWKRETHEDEIEMIETVQYDFEVIRAATNNFSDANLLGKGGFGAVYKGTLSDRTEIAVKRLSENSGQGQIEFRNEVLLVTKLQHKSLVRLFGFCLKKTERLLVYEFMSNGSLDQFLFDQAKKLLLPWDLRYKIIESVAKGLLYLHEDSRVKIIHRDLKASNILLDADMNAKISDFGMAKLFQLDESVASTIKIVGTFGYMAPEYASRGLVSNKSDVFSFGVLILEIITGRKNYNFIFDQNEDLLSCAWKNWHRGTASNIIDSSLQVGSDSMQNILRCIHIGLLCVQDNASSRPTMASVVLMLYSFSIILPLPSEPAYITRSSTIASEEPLPLESPKTRSSSLIQSSAATQSLNEASISELDPR